MNKRMIKIKRIYEKTAKSDGFRILIDRLWPRGFSKKKARVDLWLKNIAPSNELRKWFDHDPTKWSEFQKRYSKELKNSKEVVGELKNLIREKRMVTLLFSASEERCNNAAALKKILDD